MLNIWQSCILFCSKYDTILLKCRLTDTILLFFGPFLPSISSSHDPGDHTGRPIFAETWPRLQLKSIRLFPYTNNADHPKLLQADPQERGSKQHNERRRGGGRGRGAALATRPHHSQTLITRTIPNYCRPTRRNAAANNIMKGGAGEGAGGGRR